MSDALVKELDRNMDAVFDSLYVLNAAMAAIVQSLQPGPAAQVVQRLDEVIDGLADETNPPGRAAQLALHGWRNTAAKIAGAASRRL